ncbi:hypothetical protein GCM10017044_22340 [Kordiimonas sediminis]|uniref:DUF885 domain-containing protein n=1 Tax=Kordiimonas sediminis TaxID=1735581 RepID=A0A919E9S7_9PROT|nr:DUF885 domain-containing protein [Kordiimonas sediminis]GHF26836.1 hypothetical protein GCM10017044_22340 [Kordiimonas sediminis]
MKKYLLTTAIILAGFIPTSADTATENALEDLFAKERAYYYSVNPGTAPKGQPRPVADRMAPVSADFHASHKAKLQALKDQLGSIDRSKLEEESQLNYDMFVYYLNSGLIFENTRNWRMPFVSDGGFHSYLPRMASMVSLKSKEDYEAYIARLNDIPRYFDDHIANMRIGIKDGYTMPKIVLDGLLSTFSAPIVEKAEDSAFYKPFMNMSKFLSDAEKEALRAKGKDAVMNSVNAAYVKLNTFMNEEYYPAARESLGASEWPNGDEIYKEFVKYYTTLDVTPDEIHELGLQEVARIRSEMEEIIKEVGYEGTFKEFLTFLRTDEQFYAKSAKELLMHASYIAKKIDGRLPALFGKMPRQPYGVEAVPDAIAPNYTTGRYVGAPLTADRGGYYWVNTHFLDKRPLYALPALTLHEGAPGHHTQNALSKELENVPEFRLGLYPHAFGEGWGLYSEKLGLDMNIYETPYEQFGRLTYEMWRACRLVIDTGIHSKGWTRRQAQLLLEENSALSTHNIRTEVDRYISWPGQALAYKMGELKLLELRKLVEETLGEKFDIKAFHDRIMSAGGVPLTILEARVQSWIDAQK